MVLRAPDLAPDPAETPPVAVVVVTWNSRDDIEACLDSAIAENPEEIVVVDNGSTDGTPELVAERYPDIELVRLDTNTGFSAGCNLGVVHSRSAFVLFLNDDARLTPGYLSQLVDTLDHNPRAASSVGKLLRHPGPRPVIDSAGIALRAYALCPQDRGHGEVDNGQYDTPGEIFGPSAAAALYRRVALEQEGPEYFDEDMFAYYEDVDLAWRLRRRGWKHLYVPAAVAYHARRGPVGKPAPLAARAFSNRYLVWIKNESLLRFVTYAPLALSWETARVLKRAVLLPSVLEEMPAVLRRGLRVLRKRRQP